MARQGAVVRYKVILRLYTVPFLSISDVGARLPRKDL